MAKAFAQKAKAFPKVAKAAKFLKKKFDRHRSHLSQKARHLQKTKKSHHFPRAQSLMKSLCVSRVQKASGTHQRLGHGMSTKCSRICEQLMRRDCRWQGMRALSYPLHRKLSGHGRHLLVQMQIHDHGAVVVGIGLAFPRIVSMIC